MELYDHARKTAQLRAMIHATLRPLIRSEYVLLDCPYHYNIGDILIWRGEADFLRTLPYPNVGHSSMYTFRAETIPPAATILLHGGGNFGDVWREHSLFRNRIVESFPDNPIVILPQTVHYNDLKVMRSDAELFSRHSDLTICARDSRSYEILTQNFSNRILLLPDMAFCIDTEQLTPHKKEQTKGDLYLMRGDHELAPGSHAPDGYVVRDWPAKSAFGVPGAMFALLRASAIASGRMGLRGPFERSVFRSLDSYAGDKFAPRAVKIGVEMLSSYHHIRTTRLHGAILSTLLEKDFTLEDNSYGKNSTFYRTWLEDLSGGESATDSTSDKIKDFR